MGLKRGAIGNTLGEHIGNLEGTYWEQRTNENKSRHFKHMLSFPIGCMKFLLPKLFITILAWANNTPSINWGYLFYYIGCWIGLCVGEQKKLSWPMKLLDLVIWIFLLNYLKWTNSCYCKLGFLHITCALCSKPRQIGTFVEKLLGQKMVDEIDSLFPCLRMFLDEKFCNTHFLECAMPKTAIFHSTRAPY